MQDILGQKLEFYKLFFNALLLLNYTVTYGAIIALAGPNVACA